MVFQLEKIIYNYMIYISNLLNCWNSILVMNTNLMSTVLQHNDEIGVSVICGEIRKKQLNDLWCKPTG
jgi:hypothetical protein